MRSSLRTAWRGLASRGRSALLSAALASLSSVASAQTVLELAIPTNGLAYDAVGERLWVSIPSIASAHGNEVIPIDPRSGRIGRGVFVGSEPGPIAIAGDGSVLYVGLLGAEAVRRVNLPVGVADFQFRLGVSLHGFPFTADEIEVMPGNSGVVAVARGWLYSISSHGGIAIYENGDPRPTSTTEARGANRIAFDDTGAVLYGYNDRSTGYEFYKYGVDASGITKLAETRGIVDGFDNDIIFHSGRVISSLGYIVDPAVPALLGRLAISTLGAIAADASLSEIYFADQQGIRIYDWNTFQLRSSLALTGVTGNPDTLTRWGSRKLAFRTNYGQVFIVDLDAQPGDSDRDGVANVLDNCATAANASQLDGDGDGEGDT